MPATSNEPPCRPASPPKTHHNSNDVSCFHRDGYLILPQLFSHELTSRLLDECLDAFHAVLNHLKERGDIQFSQPSKRNTSSKCNVHTDDIADNINGQSEDTSCMFEYPLGQGVKCGFKELVMRSPGRYELALLVEDENEEIDINRVLLPRILHKLFMHTQQMKLQMQYEQQHNDGFATTSCYHHCDSDCSTSQEEGVLDLLVGWIREGIKTNDFTNTDSKVETILQSTVQDHCLQENQPQYAHDAHQLQTLLNLVKAIFGNTPIRLTNLSLLLSTPGSTTQTWHADGGHISLQTHESCHCLNIFVPLIDLPLTLGPTELRPGSHYYTRDLTKMMLGAMARRELQPTIVPELTRGGALCFDYRILHRGRANLSHCTEEVGGGMEEDRGHGGSDRPVLVMTFSKDWFVDVLNFPKNSLLSLHAQQNDTSI